MSSQEPLVIWNSAKSSSLVIGRRILAARDLKAVHINAERFSAVSGDTFNLGNVAGLTKSHRNLGRSDVAGACLPSFPDLRSSINDDLGQVKIRPKGETQAFVGACKRNKIPIDLRAGTLPAPWGPVGICVPIPQRLLAGVTLAVAGHFSHPMDLRCLVFDAARPNVRTLHHFQWTVSFVKKTVGELW